MSIYDEWKKSKENNIFEQWKKERQQSNNINTSKIEKKENKTIWDDIKGVASNFTSSIGNLLIGAYKNVNRVNEESIQNRNQLLNDTKNEYMSKILQKKGYTEKEIDESVNKNSLENIANNSKILNSVTDVASKIINPIESKFEEWENNNNQKIQKNIENASNPITKKILELTPSIAQSSVNLIPGGNVLFTAGITQNYYEQAKNEKGMNDEEASKYASIMATMESASEMVGTKLTKGIGKSLLKGNVKSALTNFGLDIGENFLEEAIMEPIEELTTTAVAGEEKADWSNIGKRILQSGIDGALTSILMGGASAGIGSAANVVNKITNNQTVTKTEIQTAMKDIQDSKTIDIEGIVKNEIKNSINRENKAQNQENSNNILPTNINTIQEDKMSQNAISDPINSMLNNKQLPMQNFQYQKSDNAKIDNLRQDANKYFTNSEQTRNYINMLEKIITDKDIEIRFDTNLMKNGKIVNGTYSNGVITINPNSTRAGEFIAIHELTHAIGTKEMLNIVNNYKQSNKEFNTAVKELLKNYNETEITEEALADVSAQLFGNQEFINNLAQNNPTIFQRIYNEIKYLWHQFRGYKNQNQFIEDLQYKWEQVYRSNNKLNKTSNFSIQTDNNGNRYVRVDIDQDIFEGIDKKDYNKIAKMYMQDYLLGNTTLADNDTAIIDKKSANKYTNPGNTQYKFTEKMQLTPELKNVLKISEKISQKLPAKANSKYSNWEYYKFRFSIGNNNFEGIINIGIDSNGNKHFYEINNIKKTSILGTSLNNRTGLSSNSILPTQENVNNNTKKYSMQESENNSDSFNLKEKQLEIIQNNNPMQDDYHTGVRKLQDIKTFEETLQDSDWAEYDEFNPDFIKNMAEEAIKTGKIIVYSSYPIKQGTFISPSYMEAESYSENGKVYSKEVNLKDVAWIDPTQGQYAKVENTKYSKQNKKWQEYLEENFKSEGTKTKLQDIKLPTTSDIYKMNNKEKVDLLTDEDYEVLNKIYEKEGKTEILTEKKKANLLEKYANDKYAIKDSLDIITQKVVNKGHYIDRLAEKSNNLELKYAYDRNLNSFAEGQYVVGVAQTDNNGKKIGKSINDIWKPIEESNLTKEFSEYLLHKHNIDRSERGKYVFGEEIGPAESTKIALELEKKYPKFKEWQEDIKKFNHNNLNNLKEAGMLTQDTIDYIESMYPNYITISRNVEDSLYTGQNDKTGAISPLKKATGGNSDIQPIKDTMAQQAIKIKRLVNQNNIGKQLAKSLSNAQIDEGVDIEISPSELFDMDNMIEINETTGDKYYLYFENGKQQKLKINDNLYESLKPTERSKAEKTLFVRGFQKVTSIHRSLLTSSNPLFVVTNFFKDFQDGAFNSKYSSKFIKNYGKALNEIYTKGKYYQSYMANGGSNNTYFDYDEGIKKHNKFVQKIRDVNEIVEQLPRLAEFISTLEDGKSLNEALYNAAEITTNFKRGGDVAKALNRNGVNFLNASIQGLDKQFRNFSGQNGAKGYVNLLAKATIMSIIPSVLNHILLDDDEDYQDLPQSTKDLYYLFKYDDGKFIRIPKGRVLSIFGSAARRTLEMTQGQEDAWEGFRDTIKNQVAPNNPFEDNIFAPIYQVRHNETWYGGELVSSRLQEELPENQYDETTDEFSKWLGKQLKQSPKKINYLIDQYSGGIGDVILPIITPQAKQNVVMDKFTTDSILKNKNVGKFYETLEKQTQIANDSFATDEDNLQLKYLNSISKDMSSLYKEKRAIQMSDISNKEKTEKVRNIQEKIDELAEKGLNNYKNITKNDSYSKVGDQEYYKNSKGQWTQLTDEEVSKNTDISLKTYSDYKQKLYEKKNEKVANRELTQNQDLKNKDKIQILLDSKYSDKEIKNIYENYIKSSKDSQYDIVSKAGIDIKEYLKYKQQEFESDKEDDGTAQGKTISGSKKKKEYEYVNNMNITYEQRLLILGMQYSLTNTEKTKLANYVNNMKLKKQEKLDIYEKLQGFKVYKDGRVTW